MRDWIKMEHATVDKTEVAQISSLLKLEQDAVVGKLARVWIWADENSVDGAALTVTEAFIDTIARRKGFAAAMRAAGWLKGQNGSLTFPNFTRHNGKSAKRRATDMDRKRRDRDDEMPDDKTGEIGEVTVPSGHNADGGPQIVRNSSAICPQSVRKKVDKTRTRERERSTTPVFPLPGEDPLLHRIRSLWHRRATTPWDDSERKAWGKARAAAIATTEEQWRLLTWWREADPELVPDARYRRQDLAQHLNNWNAEILRAAAAAKKIGLDFGEKKTAPGYPLDWEKRVGAEFPECILPKHFEQLPESIRRWAIEDWRRNP